MDFLTSALMWTVFILCIGMVLVLIRLFEKSDRAKPSSLETFEWSMDQTKYVPINTRKMKGKSNELDMAV